MGNQILLKTIIHTEKTALADYHHFSVIVKKIFKTQFIYIIDGITASKLYRFLNTLQTPAAVATAAVKNGNSKRSISKYISLIFCG